MDRLDDQGLSTGAVTVATRVGDCLIVTAPSELGGNCLDDLERETLSALGSAPTRGLIFELAGVQFMDSHEFRSLQRIARMAQHLGVSPVFSSIRPGIVAHLANSDADLGNIPATLGLNEALAMFATPHEK